MKPKRNLINRTLSLLLVLLLSSMAFYDPWSLMQVAASEKESLVPRAESASLESLAASGAIAPNYLLKEAALAEAGEFYSDTFSVKLQDLLRETEADEILFMSEPGLDKIETLLREHDEETILRTPADVDALYFVYSGLRSVAAAADSLPETLSSHAAELAVIIDGLKPRETIEINPNLNSPLQAAWTETGVILRWLPNEDWLPPTGYNLYRLVGKKAELLATGLGAESELDRQLAKYASDKLKDENLKANFTELISQATAAKQELSELGFKNEREFNQAVHQNDLELSHLKIISDPTYYEEYKHQALQIPQINTYSPDDLSATVVHAGSAMQQVIAETQLLEEIKVGDQVLQAQTPGLITPPQLSPEVNFAEVIAERLEAAKNARSMIKAQSNFDLDFALSTGLAYVDDLRNIKAEDHEEISYVLLPTREGIRGYNLQQLGETVYRYNREVGTVTDPAYTPDPSFKLADHKDLLVAVPEMGRQIDPLAPHTISGYGVNNTVSLRWNLPESAIQKGMISGYHVYRLGDKSKEYTLVSTSPVTPAYTTLTRGDISGTFEAPIFFADDTALNGNTYSYKIAAIDIFGRQSELSETEFEVTVIKTSAPASPTAESPYLTGEVDDSSPRWLQQAAAKLKKSAAILPLSAVSADRISSDDAVLFHIYRSQAYGKAAYSLPQLIDTVDARNKVAREIIYDMEKYTGKPLNILTPTEKSKLYLDHKMETVPGTYYVDENIQPGYSYTYWVAAVDDWDNESNWAMPVSFAYESLTVPKAVKGGIAEFVGNVRPRPVDYVPGFGEDRIMSAEMQDLINALAAGQITGIAAPIGSGTTVVSSATQTDGGSLTSPGQALLNALSGDGPSITQSSLLISPYNQKAFNALQDGSYFGRSLTISTAFKEAMLPQTLAEEYANLPDPAQILHILAYGQEDIENGQINLAWYPYQGLNLSHYAVYRGKTKNMTLADLNKLSKASVMEEIKEFVLVSGDVGALTYPILTDTPAPLQENELYIYLIAAMPKNVDQIVGYNHLADSNQDNAYGGWVKISWEGALDEALVNHYRVYRAEVASLKTISNKDYPNLDYYLLEDRIPYTYCVDSVEQSTSHSYVYKIVPVSLWNVEGSPKYASVRVPTTVAPAEPELLLPNPQPGAVELFFTAVPGATQYHIYRYDLTPIDNLSFAEIFGDLAPVLESNHEKVAEAVRPKDVFVNEFEKQTVSLAHQGNILSQGGLILGQEEEPEELEDLQLPTGPTFQSDFYLPNAGSPSLPGGSKAAADLTAVQGNTAILDATSINNKMYNRTALAKLTSPIDASVLADALERMQREAKEAALREMINNHGILSILPYSALDYRLAATVEWKEIAVVAAANQPAGKAITYVDKTTVFGKKYLYTVAAANEDLKSSRPQPVEVTAVKGEAFPEPRIKAEDYGYFNLPTGTTGWACHLQWDHVRSRYFTEEELVRDWIAGYIVYRSDKVDGRYYQVSGLLSDTEFFDASCTPLQEYFYRIKTVDTAGFITEFHDDDRPIYQGGNHIATPDIPLGPQRPNAQTTYAPKELLNRQLSQGRNLEELTSVLSPDLAGLSWNSVLNNVITAGPLQEIVTTAQEALLGGPSFPQTMPGLEDANIIGLSNIIDFIGPVHDPYNIEYYYFLRNVRNLNDNKLNFQGFEIIDIDYDTLAMNPLWTDPDLPPGHMSQEHDAYIALYGSGKLVLGESRILLPVNFMINRVRGNTDSNHYTIFDAKIELASSPYYEPLSGIRLDQIGIHISSFYGITKDRHFDYINTHVLSKVIGSYTYANNFLGQLKIFPITNGELTPQGQIITRLNPIIHWDDFTFHNVKQIIFDMDAMNKDYQLSPGSNAFPITFKNGKARTTLRMPSIDNSGIDFAFETLGLIPGDNQNEFRPNHREAQKAAIINLVGAANVNPVGNINGIYGKLTAVANSYVQLVTPTGISVRADEGQLIFVGKKPLQRESKLKGHVVLPFFEAPADLADGDFVARLEKEEQVDSAALILSLYGGQAGVTNVVLDQLILNVLDEVIDGTLLVMDGRTYGLSSFPFSLSNWDGRGFLLNDEELKPVLVGNYDLSKGLSKEATGDTNTTDVRIFNKLVTESFVVRAPQVSIDLSYWYKVPGVDQNKWYADPAWMGIVLNEGSISLSRSILELEGDTESQKSQALTFYLAKNEMIYDRNGFNYYNKLDPEEPLPIKFGENYGGFTDANMSYLEFSIKRNRYALTIIGAVKIPLLGNESFDYAIYTNPEGQGENFAVLRPKVVQLSAANTHGNTARLNITSGYFDGLGVHVNGALQIKMPGELDVNMEFNELLIPASPWELTTQRSDLAIGETLRKGSGNLAKPIVTNFNGYPVELRTFEFLVEHDPEDEGPNPDFKLGLALTGSATLTESQEMTDYDNAHFFIAELTGQTHVDLTRCQVHITLPTGKDGIMSGTVTPVGDKERTLSNTAGEESPSYKALKEVQARNQQALDIAGQAEAIRKQIDDAIAEANRILSDVEAYGAELTTKLKKAMRDAVLRFQKDKDAVHNNIVNETRATIDKANIYITLANRNIDAVNAAVDKYAEFTPEQKEKYKDGLVPPIDYVDKKELVGIVETYSSNVLKADWIEKSIETLLAEIDALNFNMFAGMDYSQYVIPFNSDDLILTALLEPITEVLTEAKARIDEVVEYYDEANKYINQMDEYFADGTYPGFKLGENGIVEFKPKDDAFCMAIMKTTDIFEGSDMIVDGRIGWKMETAEGSGDDEIDPDLYFYAFVFAYIPDPEKDGGDKTGGGVKMGAMELQNIAGMVAYNFILPYTQGGGIDIGAGKELFNTLQTLEIDYSNQGHSFLALTADMYIKSTVEKHLFAIKEMSFVIENTGTFQVSGYIYGPDELSSMAKAGPNNSTTLYGYARLTYNAPLETFEFRATLYELAILPGIKLGGTIGFDWGPGHWMLYLGYPETLKLTYEPWSLTGGFGLQLGVNPITGNPVIKVKLEVIYYDEFTVLIVYAQVSAYAKVLIGYGPWNMLPGETELLWFNQGNAFEGFAAGGELGGSIRGGIKVLGFRYEIIRLTLDSSLYVVNPREDYTYLQHPGGYYYYELTKDHNGNLVKDVGRWHLRAQIRLSYHIDLCVATFSDSFTYTYRTSFQTS